METDALPQYMRIAASVAERIAEGQFAEGEKLSGRSKLSSEYAVSPETIRKAVQLLRDMRVVSVKEQSGVYVLSADSARRYLQTMQARNALVDKKYRLRALLEQQENLTKQVSELCRRRICSVSCRARTARKSSSSSPSPSTRHKAAGYHTAFTGRWYSRNDTANNAANSKNAASTTRLLRRYRKNKRTVFIRSDTPRRSLS